MRSQQHRIRWIRRRCAIGRCCERGRRSDHPRRCWRRFVRRGTWTMRSSRGPVERAPCARAARISVH
eukprot:574542-Prymnesium_polylepis.1